MNEHKTPKNSLFDRQDKDSYYDAQLKTFFQFLQKNVSTASMVSDLTGISEKNICRYKRKLEKAGLLWKVEKAICKKTGFKAWYLTTDESKAPKLKQLNLF